MAYNASNETRKELARIQKNQRGDYIVVTEITNNNSGNVSIDVRNYYTNDNDEVLPTQKGVRVNSEMLLDLLRAMTKSLEANEAVELAEELLADEDDMDEEETEDDTAE